MNDPSHLLGRIDAMIATGRITEDEAARLRNASDADERDATVQEIRARHARARVQAAVDDGRLPRAEADDIIERLDNGEDPQFVLRLRLARRGVKGRE